MARMITNPSTMPAVSVLASQMTSMKGPVMVRRSKGLRVAVSSAVPSLGREDIDVKMEASTILQSQLMDFTAVARIAYILAVRK